MREYKNESSHFQILFILLCVVCILSFPQRVHGQRNNTDLEITATAVTDSSVTENGILYGAVSLGSVYHYNINLHNLTEVDADSVVITQILPADVTFMASSFAPGSIQSNMLSWTLDELKSQDTLSWQTTVMVNSNVPGDVDELICFSSFTCLNDTAGTNNSYTDIVKLVRPNYNALDVGVEISVQTDTTIERLGINYPAVYDGNNFEYSIRVFNNGPIELESIQVVQELAENVISTHQEPAVDNQFGRQLVWFFPTLGIGADTTIFVEAQGDYLDESPIVSSVRVSALNETANENNVDSIAIWLLENKMPLPIHCDLDLSYQVLTDSSAIVNGVETSFVRYYESFAYQIYLQNNGPATAFDIHIENDLPEGIGARLFNQTPDGSTKNRFIWQLDSLAVGAAWSMSVIVSVSDEIVEFPHHAVSTARVSAVNDTSISNNEKQATVIILGDPIAYPDVSLKQSVEADSFQAVGSEYLPVVTQNEYYRITVDLANWSLADAENVVFTYIVDDSLEILGTSPSSDVFSSDSVVWYFDSVPANSSAKYIIDVQVAPIMPAGQNVLTSVATVSAGNEDQQKTGNNQSILKMMNHGIAAGPFEPLLSLTPENPSVSDSIRVRVYFPVNIVDWDVWVYLPNGDIIKDFADSYIRLTDILPGEWYDIDVPFLHPTLIGETDELVFELHATGLYGIRAIARQQVIVIPGFDLVPPNIVEPGTTEIPIEFVVPAGHVQIKIFDVSGRHILDVLDEDYPSGRHTLVWNGMTDSGQLVGSGVYLVTLHTEQAKTFRKMIIVR